MKYPVLILNLDYTPFDIWDWQHAITKYLCTNSVEAIYKEDGMIKYDRILRDGKGNNYDQPAVLRLTQYIKAHGGPAPYTKINIYARDFLFYTLFDSFLSFLLGAFCGCSQVTHSYC